MPYELRIIRCNDTFYGFTDGERFGFRADTVLEIFAYFYGRPSVTEAHCFDNVQTHLHPSMCLWLFGNDEWWFARIGGVQFEDINFDITIDGGDPQQISRLAATSFSDYDCGASRVNWTDAISRINYDYEDSVWWRDIHNAGTAK